MTIKMYFFWFSKRLYSETTKKNDNGAGIIYLKRFRSSRLNSPLSELQ